MKTARFEWEDFYGFIIMLALLAIIAKKPDEKLISLLTALIGWVGRGWAIRQTGKRNGGNG